MTEKSNAFIESATEDFKKCVKEGRWYVVHTYSGHEGKVKVNIEKTVENCGYIDDIFEVVVPTKEYVPEVGGAGKLKERKIFPGYVFAKTAITDVSWYLARSTRGVIEPVGPESKLIAASEKEIQKFALKNQSYSKEGININVEGNVNTVSGAFNDQASITEEINIEKAIYKVSTSLFDRDTSVETSFDDVEKI